MALNIKLKQGVEANRLGVTPLSGEPLWTTDEKKLYIGDGLTAGGVAIAMAGASVDTAEKGANNGIATLDATGKIPTSQLPALAVTDVNVVADIAGRDGLTVQEGDVAIVTDVSKSFIYDGTAWQEMKNPSDAVASVNGKTGTVVLELADLGNIDNTVATDGQVLAWDNATSKWKAITPSAGVTTFNALTDTQALGAGEAGKILVVNGSGDGVVYTDEVNGGTF